MYRLVTGIMLMGLLSGGVWAEEKNAVDSENNAVITETEMIQTTAIEGDYEYADVTDGVEITNYLGAGENVAIPATLGGKDWGMVF